MNGLSQLVDEITTAPPVPPNRAVRRQVEQARKREARRVRRWRARVEKAMGQYEKGITA
ncbi:hypothetical protein J2Y69_002482 [Microbacterium resistens]|uniref:Uncharacterized protein n=1 Tax=Microbacterium resistens TaxID=156977 RepID=A0ABU1SE80_9MICO|nr:hypothetical protein [Microbacterium resistens]MDR6867874.1 hypothetical protein [Microbacterium resistens]